ncbi:hypothetical protein ES705_33109 [subsurface metagenome]
MELYRITAKKWAKNLVASGYPARWNSHGIYTIYTASSRALACLENLVHRDITALGKLYRVSVIYVPPELNIEPLKIENLPKKWPIPWPDGYALCQTIGDKWNQDNNTVILKVPSAIIKSEFNYLINPNHKDFSKLKIMNVEPFLFDNRL